MSSKTKSVLFVSLTVIGALAGCAVAPMVGSKPGDVPPRIVVDPKDAKNRTWDNPGAFGPVPAELAAKGQAVCGSLDTKDAHFQAIGYHPLAKDLDGKPFAGGGYFCVAKN